ncbi:hypothetical protein SGGMMB4_03928 [Sodalis glossinidius str. 'morsitans']|uniref:Uncharacterized protein n=1 Tax=Sodalis glossinidius (strain morsitans) TaxID=343509 RepID=A0A193QKY4_SODGM|nr:hypothetical protein [Sodalis glossinidius]CRL45836.1 hypothetical protein SGGMMB4_03928 [Sodalis glossinidius str. 'morsitans']
MHNDEKTRLSKLSDKLTDVVLEEADPDNWPGAGKAIDAHTKQERGDRYWCKKNAATTLTLFQGAYAYRPANAWGNARRPP